MAIVPFNRQDRLSYKPLTNMLDDFFGDAWRPMHNLLNETFKLDVREELKHYTIEAEMPGVDKKDISISFQDGRLTIAVTHKEKVDDEKKKYIHMERLYTDTQRSVYLAGASGNGITAALKDGELHITVPKEADTVKSTSIEIK